MSIDDIESAVANLGPDELSKFRAWFVEFDNDTWDREIESDASLGKLDAMADEALREHRAGESHEL